MKANRPHRPRRRGIVSKARALATAAGVLLLAGSCTAPGPVAVATAPAAVPARGPAPGPRLDYAPQVPTTVSWQDLPLATGEWRWSRVGASSVARFGEGAATRLALTCRRDGGGATVTLAVAGTPGDGGPSPTLFVRTTTVARPLSGLASEGTVAVALGARDPLLDAMAFSRGRFVVEVQGMATLAVPSWPEVARVIEDCR